MLGSIIYYKHGKVKQIFRRNWELPDKNTHKELYHEKEY